MLHPLCAPRNQTRVYARFIQTSVNEPIVIVNYKFIQHPQKRRRGDQLFTGP